MHVYSEAEDRENWKSWLPTKQGNALRRIRAQVHRIHARCKQYPQPRWFTPHGCSHYRAVEHLIHRLIPGSCHKQLTEWEKFFLLGSAWLHDLGMLNGIFPREGEIAETTIRDEHHLRSQRYIENQPVDCGITESQAQIFGLLAKFHRRRCDIFDCPLSVSIEGGLTVRVRLLAAYLRLADALHADQTRAPSEQYAISLAYDIPNSSKLHWIKSMFVLGTEANPERHVITVYFKHPDLPLHQSNYSNSSGPSSLDEIYKKVINDLSGELDSVKDVLIDAGVTYYLRIEWKKVCVALDDQLSRDINTLVEFDRMFENPSSSALSAMVLATMNGILLAYCPDGAKRNALFEKSEPRESSLHDPSVAKKAIETMLDDVQKGVLTSRRCHTSLHKLVRSANELLKKRRSPSDAVEDIRGWIRQETNKSASRRRNIRRQAMKYFFQRHVESKLVTQICENFTDETYGKGQRWIEHRKIHTFNVLLYGYSDLVIKALCGFRDAVMIPMLELQHKSAKEAANASERYIPLHCARLEEAAAQHFRIFVCEGQPKNRMEWGGRIAYHDGASYALALAQRNFGEICIIPDAIAATLINPDLSAVTKGPGIDFVMVGANSFGESIFRHSAGHAMIIALATSAGDRLKAPRTPEGQRPHPKVVLAVTTDKYDETTPDEDSGAKNSEGTESIGVNVRNGWPFRAPFSSEPIRETCFVSSDQELQTRLRKTSVTLYNPREDRIPINCVDVVIADHKWLENLDYELSGKDIIAPLKGRDPARQATQEAIAAQALGAQRKAEE
jgi:hypothetical protein